MSDPELGGALPQGPADASAEDERAISDLVIAYGEAWNRHDPDALVLPFASHIDHVSVRGRWQRSRAELKETYTQFHPTVWKDVSYEPVVEHIRFLRPDVAVAIVRGEFRSGDATQTGRSTWVMSKEQEGWLVRAFHQTYLQDIPIAPSARE